MSENTLSKLRFVEGFCGGLAFSSTFLISGLLFFFWSESWLADFSNYIIALVAIISAYATIRAIRSQVEVAVNQERERFAQKSRAKRAILVLVISDLYRCAWSAANTIWNLDLNAQLEWQRLTTSIDKIEEIIEYSKDKEAAELVWLVQRFQILNSRTIMLTDGQFIKEASHEKDRVQVGWVFVSRSERLYDWVEFMANIESIYDYARNEVNSLEIEKSPPPNRIRQLVEFRIDPVAQAKPIWHSFVD